MLGKLSTRFLAEPDKRVLWKFLYNFGWKGMRAVGRHRRRLKRGERFPAFVIVSITNACNLSCQGCWVTPSDPPEHLAPEALDRVITASKRQGSYFFGILGGEPLLYPGLLGVLAQHPDCYFQLFTNGMLLSDEIAETLRRLGNVTPLVSIEGLEDVSDVRRGGKDVYRRALDALDVSRRHGLVTGVATSVCQSNFKELVSETFVEKLIEHGVLYVWYYIYRPTGSDPSFDLALDAGQITALRRFMV